MTEKDKMISKEFEKEYLGDQMTIEEFAADKDNALIKSLVAYYIVKHKTRYAYNCYCERLKNTINPFERKKGKKACDFLATILDFMDDPQIEFHVVDHMKEAQIKSWQAIIHDEELDDMSGIRRLSAFHNLIKKGCPISRLLNIFTYKDYVDHVYADTIDPRRKEIYETHKMNSEALKNQEGGMRK